MCYLLMTVEPLETPCDAVAPSEKARTKSRIRLGLTIPTKDSLDPRFYLILSSLHFLLPRNLQFIRKMVFP